MTRWTPRAVARATVAGLVIIAMGLVPGAASSAGKSSSGEPPPDQIMGASLAYACPFPSGAQRITVKVAGALPAAATVGDHIQPGQVTITPTLPRAALADLTGLDATSVTASARISVTVAQKGGTAATTWPSAAASAPIPASGSLPLPGSATVSPVTAKAVGSAAFVAGSLSLVLTPHKADGSATNPAGIPLDCKVEPGPDVVLARVPVTDPGVSVTPSPGTGGAKLNPRSARPLDDDPCLLPVPQDPIPGEAYLAGFANAAKLGGAILLGVENGETTGHTLLELNYEVILNLCATDSSVDVLSRATLDYHGAHSLPPAKATLLTYGFMPTTATVEFSEPPGTHMEIDSHSWFDGTGFPQVSTVTSQMTMRIYDVLVNGKPLDVGPHCQTASSLAVTLTGKSPDYTVDQGGPLTGMVTIPPFSGCGVGEDLDPIFTASLSGPDNYMKLTQGIPCTRPPDQDPVNCDPIDRPTPRP
ncbi:DUF6801 domain-containing protein [Actinoallomurus sp. CA-142502]|uniref:DUF6801 domain-containing protein n=1 Tax=Actinoallomurus sp. CA-142502 TaxID=3239885 RepID=UPI003D9349B3